MPRLSIKTSKYSSEEYSDRLTRTYLGVGPSFGGLSVPELRTGLNSLLRSCKTLKNKTRADSINCYKTARGLEGVKTSTLKKNQLLEQLKPYRRDVKRIKVEVGLAPKNYLEEKVFKLEKDPKLKYKVQAYKAADWSTKNGTVISDLIEDIVRIEGRRKKYGLPSLPKELLDVLPEYKPGKAEIEAWRMAGVDVGDIPYPNPRELQGEARERYFSDLIKTTEFKTRAAIQKRDADIKKGKKDEKKKKTIKKPIKKTKAQGLAGMKFLFTGGVCKECQAHIEGLGGVFVKSYSKKVDVVITKDKSSGSSKLQKAQKDGKKIIDWAESLKL